MILVSVDLRFDTSLERNLTTRESAWDWSDSESCSYSRSCDAMAAPVMMNAAGISLLEIRSGDV